MTLSLLQEIVCTGDIIELFGVLTVVGLLYMIYTLLFNGDWLKDG